MNSKGISPGVNAESRAVRETPGEVIEIDARGLEPPQPLVVILEAAEILPRGTELRAHTARRGHQLLDLTKTEWALLECLMRHPGQTLTRQNILDYVWSYESGVQTTMVDVYISYLRNKLSAPGMKDPILTKRGIGYALDPDHA